jgi:galacturan 1,4-alpha-galacturonidase
MNVADRDNPVASDLLFQDMNAEGLRGPAFAISQCTTFSGASGNCSSSEFQIYDVSFRSIYGTTTTEDVASFQCSGVKPCYNISITNEHLVLSSNDSMADAFLCSNVIQEEGFNCTGSACVGSSSTGGC